MGVDIENDRATSPLGFLAGGGELGGLIRAFDWASTPLGPPEAWLQSLKAVVRIMLTTRLPMCVFWGPELRTLHNDACAQLLGLQRGSVLLGQPARRYWNDSWSIIGPQIDQVMQGKGSTWHENQPLPVVRNGRLEDAFWSYSCGPIDDEDASVGVSGVFVLGSETTRTAPASWREAFQGQRAVQDVRAERPLVDALTFDAAGRVDGALCEAQDVAQRMDVAMALRESEENYRHAAELNPQVSWTAGPAGRLDMVSERWREWTGLSGLHASWSDVAHPDDRRLSGDAWLHSIATGDPYDVEHRVRMKTGEYRWKQSRAWPRRDKIGTIIKWYGTTEDIHDRKLAEMRLQESEARCRTMTEALPQLVWTCLPDGQCNYLSRQWIDYTGMEEDAQLGLDWLDRVIHPDDRARTYDHWMGAVRGEHPYDIEYRIRRHDGAYRWFKTRGTPLRDHAGHIVSWFGTCTDICDIVEARDVLARSQAELDALVHERTVELQVAQDALRQSQKLEAMGQLTGGVAHDFNNLLTPILGNLDLLQRRRLGGEREQRMIEGALASAERAKTLVQRLLAFARRQPLQPRAVDVGELVEGMGDLLRSTAGPRVTVDFALDPDLPPAHADANQLEMALLNLAVNARDAMPEGGRLKVTARFEDVRRASQGLEAGCYVCVSVADTGMGMDEATIARAIEPFFSTKGIGKGTGLGLSMVHGLASQLGGALRISSRLGAGTQVALWLPVSAAPFVRTTAVAPAIERPIVTTTALLVEDEELVRMSSADMLADLGYRVIEAASAAEALGKVREGVPFDVLITDHLMPGMTGEQLVHEVRALRPGMPVLMVSGYAETGGVSPDLPRLVKPFRKDELAARLRGL